MFTQKRLIILAFVVYIGFMLGRIAVDVVMNLI